MDIEIMTFNLVKNILIKQNEMLLTNVAKQYNLDTKQILDTYLTPQFYLPVFETTLKRKFKQNGAVQGEN